MKNKTVIRRPNQAGEFTTIHHSILYDTRLSALELRIFMSILSDADHFNLTQTLLINRFGIDKKTLQKAFLTLEKCGYLRRRELKRGHYYTVSEYGNLSKKDETTPELVQQQIEPTAKEQLPVEKAVTNPINLADYNDLIVSLLPSHVTDDNIMDVMSYLLDAIGDGRLIKPEQMNKSNLEKIINKVIPINNTNEKIKRITEICDTYAGGKQITIANKKEITSKVIKYFIENSHLEPTEKAIRSRILMYKTSYTSSGYLDQKYQN